MNTVILPIKLLTKHYKTEINFVNLLLYFVALIYKEKKPRPTCDKTQHLVVNDDFPDKNHADEKILLPKENETSVENSYLDFDKTTVRIII